MKKDHIKIKGHRGTWYVIDKTHFRGQKVYLLEHEQYGDEAPALIIDENLNVIMDDVYNGFADLDEL